MLQREHNKKKHGENICAQATLEFAFTFLIVVLIIYGCVKVLQWLGLGLGTPSEKHYQGLYSQCNTNDPACHPTTQLSAADEASGHALPKLNAVFRGELITPP